MGTTSTAAKGFLLTVQSIEAAIKTGKRRHLSVEYKGLELEVLKKGRPQFRYYWKDRTGDKAVDRRVWLVDYDRASPKCLVVARMMWEQASELRQAGLSVVLERPEAAPSRPETRAKALVVHQVVNDYVAHLQRSVDFRSLSVKTAKPWMFIIRRFERAMKAVSLDTIDAETVESYLDGLVTDAVKRGAQGLSTRMNAHACLTHFFQWAVEKRLVSNNPAKGIRRTKYKRDHTKIADEVLSRYLAALRRIRREGERIAVSNYLWLLMLTGCRRDELSTATIGDFYLAERQRRISAIRAKDGKPHYTGISYLAVSVVREQIDLLKQKGLPTGAGDLLFPAASALKKIQRWHGDGLRPMSGHVIYKHHREVSNRAGIEPFTLHDFRRIFATMAARLGIDSDYQRLLISHTTGRREAHEVYNLHRYEKELREAASRLAVVFDFLSAETIVAGRRSPLQCQDDFVASRIFWNSEDGREFASSDSMAFSVEHLVRLGVIESHVRDVKSGYAIGEHLANLEVQRLAAAQEQETQKDSVTAFSRSDYERRQRDGDLRQLDGLVKKVLPE